MFNIGSQLEDYKLTRLLGTGATSQVWEALDPNLEKVAIKIFSPDRPLEPHILKSLKRQIEVTRSLRHEGIVTPLSWGDDSGRPYIVFSYYSTTLMKLIGERKEALKILGRPDQQLFQEDEIAHMFYDVSDALSYLHSNRVKHRDIKPDNILIDQKPNQKRKFFISDFGASVDLKMTIMKEEGNLGLTPTYASPEQFDGKDHFESDIFSLGITIYEMCHGDLPFPLLNAAEAIRGGNSLPALENGYSQRLNELIKSCLELDPKKRPTAIELRNKALFYIEEGYWPEQEQKPPTSSLVKRLMLGALIVLISLLFFVLFQNFSSKNLIIFMGENGKYGLKRGKELITPPIYDKILPFKNEEVITVKIGKKCKWINGNGIELLNGKECDVCYKYSSIEELNKNYYKIVSCGTK